MSKLLLEEITDWEYPNHLYVTNESKSKVYGYFIKGSDKFLEFKKPFSFDTRHRKFKKLAVI
jgi:hypothetical protein